MNSQPYLGARPRVLLKDEVYVQLRDAIVSQQLSPGTVLKNPEMERWLGVSRTTIRDALNRLQLAGLVVSAPNRYTRVSEMDASALESISHALTVLISGLLMHSANPEARAPELPEVEARTDSSACFKAYWAITEAIVSWNDAPALTNIVSQQFLPLMQRDAVGLRLTPEAIAEFNVAEQGLHDALYRGENSVAVEMFRQLTHVCMLQTRPTQYLQAVK
ncbi:GntR family transcriptional regulator [Paeniglutamicibacter sp. NPDC012692]|uniref:GntR family transcriptional regulator n=1 Tax=Paeniglutamicibacter sp. NPDC012692 TaxID=3364388 RepID=UPI003675CA2B